MQSGNDTRCYTITNKSEHTIGQIWVLKCYNIFLSNSEGSFETAQCHLIFLPCEPGQMKMEIQKKIWTSRNEKRALTVAFVHTCALKACADPGIFVKGFQKTAWTFFFCFLVLNLFYRRGPMVLLQRNLYFSKDPKGSNIFRGGGGGGGGGEGGAQMIISVIFQGVPTPISPLDPHMNRGAV